MRSELYFSIIGVLGLIVISLVIVLIVIAARESSPIISFYHYTAEIENSFMNGDKSGIMRSQKTREVVFSKSKWYVESYYEDEVISRIFSKKDDGSITSCEVVSDHGNCYTVTKGVEGGFVIPRSAVKQESETDCSMLSSGSRVLDKCDVYVYSEGVSLKRAILESGSDYPVIVEATTSSDVGVVVTTSRYLSFSAEKPTDESGLEAFEGVKVYDFRNGEGDAGDGKSNIYKEGSLSERMKKSVKRMISTIGKKFSTKAEEKKKDSKLEKYIKAMKLNEEVKGMLHLPGVGLPRRSNLTEERRVRRSGKRGLKRDLIPETFDAREYWTDCEPVINYIRDQGACGSCWAMAGAGVMSDRYCIATGKRVLLSPQYLVYCAEHNNGCSGSSSDILVWEDIMEHGLPSEKCVPFEGVNGVCPERCENGDVIGEWNTVSPDGYDTAWGYDDEERVEAIQLEIMIDGPVEATFLAFSDYMEFIGKSTGIYHRSSEAVFISGHAIRIIGWGKEGGEDYWLVANSYGTELPGEGLFRIRRGNNECNIEQKVIAGFFLYQ